MFRPPGAFSLIFSLFFAANLYLYSPFLWAENSINLAEASRYQSLTGFVLKGAMGRDFEASDKLSAVKIPTPRREDYIKLNSSDPFHDIESLNDYQLQRRVVMLVRHKAIELGIREGKIEARILENGLAYVQGPEKWLRKTLRELKPYKLRWKESHAGFFITSDAVPAATREILERMQGELQRIFRHISSKVLGADVLVTKEELRFQKPGFPELTLTEIEGMLHHVRRKSAEFADRFIGSERNAAVANWKHEITSTLFSIENYLEQLHALKSEVQRGDFAREYSLDVFMGHFIHLHGLQQRSVSVRKIPDEFYIEVEQEFIDLYTKGLAQIIRQQQISSNLRHTLVQYNHVNPAAVIPLFSYNLLLAFTYIERQSEFRPELYQAEVFDFVMHEVLREYVREDFYSGYEADNMTRQLLVMLAKQENFADFIRLTAFSLLAKRYDLPTVTRLTEIDRNRFRKLYRRLAKRAMLSPVKTHSKLMTHLDYRVDFKLNIEHSMNVIEYTRMNLGIKKARLRERLSVNDPSQSVWLNEKTDTMAKDVERLQKQAIGGTHPTPSDCESFLTDK